MSLTSGLCLVTGATGFVGSAVARVLLKAGHPVRVLARRHSDRRNLEGLAVEIAEGSLEDPDSLAAAVGGCRYLFHVAADYRLWVPDPEPMFRVNVAGTRALMLAAAGAGVERIVYTSSVATLGIVPGGIADEETASVVGDMIGPYKRSKFEAEAAVTELVVERARGRMPGYVDTGLNIAHVDDVAVGHLLAASSGQIGRRYILGGENLSLGEILGEVARLTGRRPPAFKIPSAALLPIARGAEAFARMTGREPFATVDGVRMSKKKMFFSSTRAVEELGYAPRPARQALTDAIAWFKANGYVR